LHVTVSSAVFNTTPICDGATNEQTDGQTDRQKPGYSTNGANSSMLVAYASCIKYIKISNRN